jgi:hypothetical protein
VTSLNKFVQSVNQLILKQMTNQDKLLETCKRTIETRLGWGSTELWTNQDYEKLSLRILDETGVHLSAATLKRIWGKLRYDSKPSTTTLDTLAKFAGHGSWRQFGLHVLGAQALALETPVTEKPSDYHFFKKSLVFAVMGLILVAGALVFYGFMRATTPNKRPVDRSKFEFSSKKVVSEGVPNSVIFDYDASVAGEGDKVVIQQSWDPRLRTRVSKNDHQHTSIYYHPGFFHAKLLVNDKVVREHALFIKTKGWLPMLDVKPVPVYMELGHVRAGGALSLSPDKVKEMNVGLQPLPPWVAYYYVNEFDLQSDSMIFEARIRNDYREGAAACQHTEVHVLFEGFALIVPLSAKGCVSDLNFLDMDGKKKDLSALGVDFSEWVTVRAEMHQSFGELFVNDARAFRFALQMPHAKVVGMQFRFQGTGSVDHVRLSRPGGDVAFEEGFD